MPKLPVSKTLKKWIIQVTGLNSKHKSKNPYTSQALKHPLWEVGKWTYGKPEVYSFDNKTKLKIGRFCSFANNVVILLGGEHRTDWVTTYPFPALFDNARSYQGHPTSKGDVLIGNDVWVGMGALILSGTKIGDGAVIGARSIISGEVPPYSIFAGNPAKHVRYRFPTEEIDALLRISWWEWPLEKIEEAYPLLLSGKITEFIAKYDVSI